MYQILLFIIFCISISALIISCLAFNKPKEHYDSHFREVARLMRDGKEVPSIDALKPEKTEQNISNNDDFDHELHEDLRDRERMNRLRDLHQMLDN